MCKATVKPEFSGGPYRQTKAALCAVFHAGPSTAMHWFSTQGEGSALKAGTRPGNDSANGSAVMFDNGKILTCGGAESFAKPEYPSSTQASLLTIGAANTQPQVNVFNFLQGVCIYSATYIFHAAPMALKLNGQELASIFRQF